MHEDAIISFLNFFKRHNNRAVLCSCQKTILDVNACIRAFADVLVLVYNEEFVTILVRQLNQGQRSSFDDRTAHDGVSDDVYDEKASFVLSVDNLIEFREQVRLDMLLLWQVVVSQLPLMLWDESVKIHVNWRLLFALLEITRDVKLISPELKVPKILNFNLELYWFVPKVLQVFVNNFKALSVL